jgi:hypothetical protein
MRPHELFQAGARVLTSKGRAHQAHFTEYGISQDDWDLLTSDTLWSSPEARRIPSILQACINAALTIANIPSQPLPGQYVAALICDVVAPPNRIVAASMAPDTFDAVSAAGVDQPVKIEPMRPEQMLGLVVAYSGSDAWHKVNVDPVLVDEPEKKK